jgi:hypothetical protein
MIEKFCFLFAVVRIFEVGQTHAVTICVTPFGEATKQAKGRGDFCAGLLVV